jgi:hypothetical protein
MLEMKDWRGNALTPGCVVLYPRTSGRSCEVQEGILLDVWRVYKPPGSWEWKRLHDGQDVPTEEVPEWDRHFDPAKPTRPCENELRVRIQPTRSSRDFHRGGMTWDREAGKYEPPAEFKPITLTICENVTFLAPASPEAEIRHRSAPWVFLVSQHVTVTDKEGTVTGLLTGVSVDVIRVWTEQGECAVPTESVVSVVPADAKET